LKKLDQALAKHAGLESGVCAVFLTDGGFRSAVDAGGEEFGKKLADASAAKDKLEQNLQSLKKSKELDRVALGLAPEETLAAFKLDDKALATVLVCNEQNVLARHELSREKLTEQETGKI